MLKLLRGRRDCKVFVIGLDCAAPELVFEQWRDELPSFRRLMEGGIWGDLHSSIPAITVPAWSCMTSGKDPGTLGIYGFRNRRDYSYHNMTIAASTAVKERRVWDILSAAGKQIILVGVPQTFPISPVNGYVVSCFLTPSIESEFTHPASLRAEVLNVAPNYELDVHNFRTEDKDWLLRQIQDMTAQHMRVIHHLLDTKPWDFFMWVEMGVDRIHHGFWSYMDSTHPKHVPGNRFQDAIRDYYRYLDTEIGQMLAKIPDDTVVLVVSDHGAQSMQGGVCVNEWLWRNGYLVLQEAPPESTLTPFAKVEVDWTKTRAWGEGGYYGRIFLNMEGREPSGVVRRAEYEGLRDELIEQFTAMAGLDGQPLGTRCFKPQEIYQRVRNVPPDLIVYWGDLRWRSVGSLGHGRILTSENDTGPDDANHAENGLFILYDPRSSDNNRRVFGRHLMDVASTVLELMGLPVPGDMQGHLLFGD